MRRPPDVVTLAAVALAACGRVGFDPPADRGGDGVARCPSGELGPTFGDRGRVLLPLGAADTYLQRRCP